ncbi:MAG: hypothetical protein KKH28_02020 [Elusimicrobia bacterium]|nr:hypothetical protein [Elusimicrobiota bacterium]
MKLSAVILVSLALLSPLAPAGAQTLPDMHNQASWGEKDKQKFLKFLKSNQQMPVTGQVKNVAAGKRGRAAPRKARYFALNLVTDSLTSVAGDGKTKTGKPAFGPKALAGGHLFSWVRYYGGLKYTRISRDKLDGTAAKLSHLELPAGIEFALIPLGTPHTRYVLLRFGVSGHYVYGSAKSSDFQTSIKGWHPSWNAGLGYEWQISNSNWRTHLLAEGYRSFGGGKTPEFYGIGLTTGLAYTF